MVLRNRPTLIIGTERLACLNSPSWRAAGDPRLARGRSRARAPGPAGALRALFFSPSLPSSFPFSHLPHQPCKSVRVKWHDFLIFIDLIKLIRCHGNKITLPSRLHKKLCRCGGKDFLDRLALQKKKKYMSTWRNGLTC